jgi:hypothetical protein
MLNILYKFIFLIRKQKFNKYLNKIKELEKNKLK